MASIKNFIQLLNSNSSIGLSLGDLDFAIASPVEINELAAIIKSSTKEKVSFHGMNWSAVDFSKIEPIFQAISENPSITHLALYNSHLENAPEKTLNGLLQYIKLSNISSLDLSSNSVDKSNALMQFFISVARLRLNALLCDGVRLKHCTYDAIKELFKTIANNESLKLLSLGFFDYQESPEKFFQLINILLESRLDSISFADCSFFLRSIGDEYDPNINVEYFKHFLDLISKTKNLKHLNLSKCFLGDFAVNDPDLSYDSRKFIEMFENFLQTTLLQEIDVSNNHFPLDVTKRFIEAAVSNPNIKNFTIENKNMKRSEVDIYKLSLQQDALKKQEEISKQFLNGAPAARTLTYSNGSNGQMGTQPTFCGSDLPLNGHTKLTNGK